ncbi:unnamed protein product [Phytophthora lilii]|uniref:Unnamed protein product n=1 Tax=Phytophthora lilii TaxID=2077276 RepID=A0A9W6WUZ5_9STRA|nr:unnamed protein product [Phytophthora lilii]
MALEVKVTIMHFLEPGWDYGTAPSGSKLKMCHRYDDTLRCIRDQGCVVKTATLNGQVEAVDVLLPSIDEGVDLTPLITSAIAKGHDHVALLLVGTGRPFRAHDVFRAAAAAGSMEVVELLIPLADSSHVRSAVATAAEHGHIELVAMLLEKVELARIGTAFMKAAATNQVEILGLILDVWESRPSKDRAKVCAISNAVKEAISRGSH